MITYEKLGLYEYINHNQNSDKFYCVKMMGKTSFEVSWGKNGMPANDSMLLDESKLVKKVAEKLKKGYVKIPDSVDPKSKAIWIEETKNHYDTILSKKDGPDVKKVKI